MCWAKHAAKKIACVVTKHPGLTVITVVLASGAIASIGVAAAGLAGLISTESALAGLGVGEGGLHAAGTLIVGGFAFESGAAASAYASGHGC